MEKMLMLMLMKDISDVLGADPYTLHSSLLAISRGSFRMEYD